MEVIQSVVNRSLEISYVSIEISFFHLCLLLKMNTDGLSSEKAAAVEGEWALNWAVKQAYGDNFDG
jgi:hypothetical protein